MDSEMMEDVLNKFNFDSEEALTYIPDYAKI